VIDQRSDRGLQDLTTLFWTYVAPYAEVKIDISTRLAFDAAAGTVPARTVPNRERATRDGRGRRLLQEPGLQAVTSRFTSDTPSGSTHQSRNVDPPPTGESTIVRRSNTVFPWPRCTTPADQLRTAGATTPSQARR
jgi:hypothetical protein